MIIIIIQYQCDRNIVITVYKKIIPHVILHRVFFIIQQATVFENIFFFVFMPSHYH